MAIYMKFGGPTGDVGQGEHKHWIELKSFQWPLGRPISTRLGSTNNRVKGSTTVGEVVVTKEICGASPDLMQCTIDASDKVQGKDVVIHFTNASDKKEYLEIKLTETLISRYAHSSSGDYAIETISLNFTKFEYCFSGKTPTAADGPPKRVTLDLATADAS
jgi:type VI secretion system secreted protein Hcp